MCCVVLIFNLFVMPIPSSLPYMRPGQLRGDQGSALAAVQPGTLDSSLVAARHPEHVAMRGGGQIYDLVNITLGIKKN